jgi:enoyl-CoA hydratase/carnithine racemase
MPSIRTEKTDGLLTLTLSRAPANALNASMVDELNSALQQADAPDVRAVILASDRPKFFCAGFDVKEVFQYDRQQMTSYFGAFMHLYETLFRLPKPVVGAVSGHAVAGGAILALACDVRVMAEGSFRFALNEVNLGIVLPPGILRMALDAIGPRHARELFLGGETLTPPRAFAVGLAHELAQPEEVLPRALAHARALAEKPAAAFASIKRNLIELSGHAAAGGDQRHLPQFIDLWFAPESRQRRQALLDSLR